MSSAAGVLLRSQDSIHQDSIHSDITIDVSQDRILNLAHDLRQPLSAIEAIAYYLEMTLPADQIDARRHLGRLQELILRTDMILSDAVRDYLAS